jgi:3-phenylpropionate/trans-cinnamate dioxygenase ferredoxin component
MSADLLAPGGSGIPLPPGFERAALEDEVAEGELLGVVTESGRAVCLLRFGGEVHALVDRCTHQHFPLSSGSLERDGTLLCIWHGASFDCRTGAVRHPPAEVAVRTYDVRVEGGAILVGPERR